MHRLLTAISICFLGLAALAAALCLNSNAAARSQAAPTASPKPSATPAATTAVEAPATPAPAPSSTPAPAAAAPKSTYSDCHVDGPYIAMTFDDGPHGVNTPRLLDMLKQRKIHATFFLVGQCVAEFPDIVKRIVAEGHEVANHSWSHPQLSAMSESGVRNELGKTQDAIIHASGVTPKLMRPPYGAFTARQRAWAHGEWGFSVILWDVDPLDWKYRNAEHVKKEILKATVPGSIILSHDIHKTTIDAMPETLDTLLGKGFKFVTVSELIAMDRPVAPKVKATPPPKNDEAPANKTEPAAAPAATPAAAKP